MTLFSGKMLISHRCIRGLMPNLIKKSWMVSMPNVKDDLAVELLILSSGSVKKAFKRSNKVTCQEKFGFNVLILW